MRVAAGNALRIASFLTGVGLVLATPLFGQETKETVTVDDVDRTYTVRLPAGYDDKKHYPLVILLHGMNQDADDMERLTRFNEVADKNGIIAVYPSALHGRWNIGVRPEPEATGRPGGYGRRGGYPGGGYPGGYPGGGGGYPGGGGQRRRQTPDDQSEKRPEAADDVAFFNQMLDKIAGEFSIDATQVYATGISDGGFMSLRMGCNMADRITAIAPVGAAMPKTMICLPSRPIPVLMINGTTDPVVPYGGGTDHDLRVKTVSADDSAKAWAKMDRCNEKPKQSKLPHEKGGMETKVDTYDGCHENAQVVLYSVKGAGNTWPGGQHYEVEKQVGKTSNDLNANEVMWTFFAAQKLPAKDGGVKQTQ